MEELAPDCRPTPVAALLDDLNEPGTHFTRTHHGVPEITEADYALEVTGLVGRPVRWSLADLRKLSHMTAHVVLECAGHRRTELDPVPDGVPWGLGAVGHARWAGGALHDLLSIVRPLPEATHIVFHSADGEFSRAIPLADPAMRETILAWEMNGHRLTPEHGYPVRAIVPGWYAVASVKWLTRIELIAGEYDGFYQAVDYRLKEPGEEGPGRELTRVPVSSVIVAADGASVRGVAWGGDRGVAGVDVRIDGGDWQPARIDPGPGRHAPTRFSLAVDLQPGRHVAEARARDREGDVQPETQAWNERGYGVRSVHALAFDV